MNEDNVVFMDGPALSTSDDWRRPSACSRQTRQGAVAIEGEMEVDDTDRRVVVRIPMEKDDLTKLCRALRIVT